MYIYRPEPKPASRGTDAILSAFVNRLRAAIAGAIIAPILLNREEKKSPVSFIARSYLLPISCVPHAARPVAA